VRKKKIEIGLTLNYVFGIIMKCLQSFGSNAIPFAWGTGLRRFPIGFNPAPSLPFPEGHDKRWSYRINNRANLTVSGREVDAP